MPAARREAPEEAPLLGGAQQEDGQKRRSTLLTICPFILGNELCERLAFYGLSTNLVIYLTRIMGARPAAAAMQVNLFEGTCYLTPLLGAWLADARWGRYKTILVFSAIYFLGMLCLAASAWFPGLTPATEGQRATFMQNAILYGSLYIIAVGTGGIKPNVSAFGADQFDETDPQDRKEKDSFFNWFYFAINFGSLLAVTTLVYIQESVSWAIGFGIPAVAMALAVIIFMAGSPRYTHVEPTESPMTRVYRVLRAAYQARWRKWMAGKQRTAHTSGYTGGLAGFSAAQVEEVRMVLRMLPIFFTTILYWTIYVQMGSFFVEQGSQMDRRITFPRFSIFGHYVRGGQLRIPAASLALFNTVSIIALIPLYDRGLVPLLSRFGKKLSLLQRIGWGLLVCVAAMLASAAVEWRRLHLFRDGDILAPAAEASVMHWGAQGRHEAAVVNMNVFWQVPQYLLIGLSEVLASIGQLEFFYDQAPDIMRSCSMAMQLLSVAIGSYLSGAVVMAVSGLTAHGGRQGWLPDDLNLGRLDLFFLFLGGLMALNLLWFLWVARSYEYKEIEHHRRAHPAQQKPSGQAEPQWMQPQNGHGMQAAHEINIAPRINPSDAGIYGRSVTFVGQSPALPAPFR
eukprot:jgi/Astpho2/3785/Aster-04319